MKKRLISVLCVLLAVLIVLAGCEPLSGIDPTPTPTPAPNGGGNGGGSGSGGNGTGGGSGSGGNGTGGGNGSGTGGGMTPTPPPPINPNDNPNNNPNNQTPTPTPPNGPTPTPPDDPTPTPPIDPNPDLGLDGIWICFRNFPADADNDIPAHTAAVEKIVIYDDLAISYTATDAYMIEVAGWESIKDLDPATLAFLGYDITGPDPLPQFEEDPIYGDITLDNDDNSLSFAFYYDDDPLIREGTLAADGNSFTIIDEDENGDPLQLTFEKTSFTDDDLLGEVWYEADDYYADEDGDSEYSEVLNKIVFYGDKFQMYSVSDDYTEGIEEWLYGDADEYPELRFDIPYTAYGTFTQNDDGLTLTFESAPDPDITTATAEYSGCYLILTYAESDGDEIYYSQASALLYPDRGIIHLPNEDGVMDGTWFGTVTDPLTLYNDYSGFVTYKLVIDGDSVIMYKVTEACAYQMGNYNYAGLSGSGPSPVWDDPVEGTLSYQGGELTIVFEEEEPLYLDSDDDFETFYADDTEYGPVTFAQEGATPGGNGGGSSNDAFNGKWVYEGHAYYENVLAYTWPAFVYVIEDDYCSLYKATEDYKACAEAYYYEETNHPNETHIVPPIELAEALDDEDNPVELNVIIDGNTITLTDGSLSLEFELSDDGQTLTSTNMTLEKQPENTEGPIPGTWRPFEGSNLDKILVTYGNSYALYGKTFSGDYYNPIPIEGGTFTYDEDTDTVTFSDLSLGTTGTYNESNTITIGNDAFCKISHDPLFASTPAILNGTYEASSTNQAYSDPDSGFSRPEYERVHTRYVFEDGHLFMYSIGDDDDYRITKYFENGGTGNPDSVPAEWEFGNPPDGNGGFADVFVELYTDYSTEDHVQCVAISCEYQGEPYTFMTGVYENGTICLDMGDGTMPLAHRPDGYEGPLYGTWYDETSDTKYIIYNSIYGLYSKDSDSAAYSICEATGFISVTGTSITFATSTDSVDATLADDGASFTTADGTFVKQ